MILQAYHSEDETLIFLKVIKWFSQNLDSSRFKLIVLSNLIGEKCAVCAKTGTSEDKLSYAEWRAVEDASPYTRFANSP